MYFSARTCCLIGLMPIGAGDRNAGSIPLRGLDWLEEVPSQFAQSPSGPSTQHPLSFAVRGPEPNI